MLLLLVIGLFAQHPNWQYYNNSSQPNCIVKNADFLWVGTNGGLCKINVLNNERIIFNTFNSDIPSNSVLCLEIDSIGAIWIGTDRGLAVFDGLNWTIYNALNSPLTDLNITCFKTDTNGTKWIGTNSGLLSLNGISWNTYTYPSQDHIVITSISPDNQGCVWFGAYYWGDDGMPAIYSLLGKYSNGEVSYFTDLVVFPSHLAVDHDNNLWCGGSGIAGVAKFDGTTWTRYNPTIPGLEFYDINCIQIDSANNVWIGGGDEFNIDGVGYYNGQNWNIFSSINSEFPGKSVHCMFIDEQNKKWFGYTNEFFTLDGGVVSYNDISWQLYSTSFSGLPSNVIKCVALDSDDNKWFGTFENVKNGGLTKFDGTSWATYTKANSELPNNDVLCISIDSQDNKWIGLGGNYTDGGLAKFDGSNWSVFQTSNSGLPHNDVHCIAIDDMNVIWIGSGPHNNVSTRLSRFDGNWTVYDGNNSPSTAMSCINISQSGVVLIGTLGEFLFSFYNSSWTQIQSPFSDWGCYSISSYLFDALGTEWIGTHGGLIQHVGTNWIIYNTDNSGITDNRVECLATDNLGAIWIGTFEGGLARFDGIHWSVYNTENSGLLTNKINCIAIDNQNVKWIGTDEGLFAFTGSGVSNDDDTHTPEAISNCRAYPNPCRQSGTVTLETSIKTNETGSLTIYNLKGQKVKSFSLNAKSPKLTWDSRDEHNQPCAAGMYLYRLSTNKHQETKKLIILN
jgi:ligand-binding sensor domain-containing protein